MGIYMRGSLGLRVKIWSKCDRVSSVMLLKAPCN
jgi:hypothetical protein